MRKPTYQALAAKAKEISNWLNKKARLPLKQEEVKECWDAMDRAWNLIDARRPLTPDEKRSAKSHPISAQIQTFTAQSPLHKKIFSLKYFQERLKALPEDRKIPVPSLPKTLGPSRDALVIYHWWKGKSDGKSDALLRKLRESIEADFHSDPRVREIEEAKALFRELMAEKNVDAVTERLESLFQADADLKKFAKLVGVKIPANKRGGPKKSLHERLAAEIHKQGAYGRI